MDNSTNIITDSFMAKVKANEGTREYQAKMGYYKQGLFYVYKCSLGFNTIGYGHLCTPAEVKEFKQGITELKAQMLFKMDLAKAEQQARLLYQMNKHPISVQEVLVEMVYQLGAGTASKFKQFKDYLEAFDYNNAALELQDSRWYKQTPNRVKSHMAVLKAHAKK